MSIPAATAIGHVHLRVADLDRARRFYEDLLGFDLVATYDGQVAFLSAGGYHHHIALNTWGSLGGSPPPAGATGLYHFAINFPARRDLATAVRRLLAARWPIEGAADHTTHEAVYLADPDGNGLELAWDRDPSVWRAADGRIAMSTDPLDFEGLMAEAGPVDAPARAPDGTRIGHVHLKVADVGRSLAFYQGLLDFDLTARMGGSAAFLSAGRYHHHLAVNTWESRGGSRPPAGSTGIYHFAIRYPRQADLRTAVKTLLDASWPIGGGSDHGTHLAVYLRDPDHIGVELAWDRQPAEWPRAGDGRIDMARGRPLDIEAFVAEAAYAAPD
jgi:catechol 2,3-dioxygenase